MVMSADSSDCHPSSSGVVVGVETPTQSAKISVICHITNQTQQQQTQSITNQAQQQQHLNTIEASAASSTTSCPQLIMGRSHLENALKLPPNTSVSTYYQNTKLLTQINQQQHQKNSNMEESQQPQQQNINNQYQNSLNITEYQNRHLNFIRNPLGVPSSSAATASNSTPVTDMDTVPTGVSSLKMNSQIPNSLTSSSHLTPNSSSSPSSVIFTPKSSHNSLILSQALQQPCNVNASSIYQQNHHNNNNNIVSTSENLNSSYDNFLNYHHHSQQNVNSGIYQQHHNLQHGNNMPHNSLQLQHTSNVVVVAADSRPQTPDYIKSYPVMDTTVASSVKGEPELNIGKKRNLIYTHTHTHRFLKGTFKQKEIRVCILYIFK